MQIGNLKYHMLCLIATSGKSLFKAVWKIAFENHLASHSMNHLSITAHRELA